MPRTLGICEGLAGLSSPLEVYNLIVEGSLQRLASPAMIPVYERLLAAAKENGLMMATIGKYEQKLRELGY